MEFPVMFDCPNREGNLRLTESACGQSFKKWQRDRFHPCCRCEIGAAHAGLKMKPATGHACAWCGKGGQRLIFRVLCISCSNRLNELATGRWRRGKPLTFSDRLNSYFVEVDIP